MKTKHGGASGKSGGGKIAKEIESISLVQDAIGNGRSRELESISLLSPSFVTDAATKTKL